GMNQSLTVLPQGGLGPFSEAWSLGDGEVANGTHANLAYPKVGRFNVTVSVEDGLGATVRERQVAVVDPLPLVESVEVAPAEPEQGQPARLLAVFSGGTSPYLVAWQFGDGSGATGNPVFHTFPLQRSYAVTVSVTDAVGTVALGELAVPVVAALSVQALASTNRTDLGVPVLFTAGTSGGVPPVNFSWDFSDGTVAAGANVAHAFFSPAIYGVVLWGNDSSGAVSVSRVLLSVEGPPVVSMNASTRTPRVGAPVSFAADIVGGIAPYLVDWSFGDGSQTVGLASTEYAYAAPGEYRVTATAVDSEGLSAQQTLFLNVSTAGGSGPPNGSTLPRGGVTPGPDWWLLGAAGVAAVAGVSSLILLRVIRRRRLR
ncbi:MAG: PKD domain-containing protein, partial [Thermoplasmata archaeon]